MPDTATLPDEVRRSPASPAPATAAGLRIALFSGNYNCVKDGANNALTHLVAYLLEQGAAVRVYSPTIAHPAFDAPGDLVSVRSIGFPGRSEYRLSLGLDAALRDDIRAFAPTHVHVSAPDPHGYQAQTLAHRMGVPVVCSLHTRFETYFSYYGLTFARRWAERYLHHFYRRADLVLVPNAAIADEVAGWQLGNRTALWQRGVDRALFDPTRRDLEWRRSIGLADDDIALLFFGRLVREKGIADFAATVAMLRGQGVHVRPLIVGEGPARAEFSALLPADALFLGHQSGEALARAVASADLLLNPSLTEAFGNVNLEAMASGLAVVSADAPSARALIDHGHSGLLVPGHDIKGYAAAIASLVADPARRATLAAGARRRSADFRWDEVLAALVSAYRSLRPDLAVTPWGLDEAAPLPQ